MSSTATDSIPTRNVQDVLRAELVEIQRQRNIRFGVSPSEAGQEVPPAENPTGLCFSGGGIRSATFNLGLLQGLRETGVLKFIDYLSTVSGGGYIGSWFTATNFRLAQIPDLIDKAKLALAAAEQAENAAASEPKLKSEASKRTALARIELERVQKLAGPAGDLLRDYNFLHETNTKYGSPFIHHLRKFSRYLAPKAGITSGDTWTMVSIWLRNTALIQTMVISLIGALIALISGLPFVFRYLAAHAQAPKNVIPVLSDNALWLLMVVVQILCIGGIVAICMAGIRSVKGWNTGEITQERKKELGANAVLSWASISALLLIGSFLASVQLFRMVADGVSVIRDSGFSPTVSVMVALVSLFSVRLSYECVKSTRKKQSMSKKTVACVLVGGFLLQFVAGMALVTGVYRIFNSLIDESGSLLLDPPDPVRPLASLQDSSAISWICILGPILIMAGYAAIQLLSIAVFGRHMHERVKEWWGRAGAWVLMSVTLYLLATLAGIAGPVIIESVYASIGGWLSSTMVMGWVATAAAAVLAGKSSKTARSNQGGAIEGLASHLPLIFLAGLVLAVSWIVRWVLLPKCIEHGFLLAAWPAANGLNFFLGSWLPLFIVLTLLGVLLVVCVDLNEFSMNPFYRNRLERCYLGASRFPAQRRSHEVTGFDFGGDAAHDGQLADDLGDDIRLCELVNHPDSNSKIKGCKLFQGPLPIINTAINTGASAGNDVQDRSAESFAFTPLNSGFDFWRAALGEKSQGDEQELNRRICQRRTGIYGGLGGWSIGRAMSVSGAAASPNSGYHTSPLVAFMLTLFNARLGWWAPHPGNATWWEKSRPRWTGFFGCLFKELTGSASIDSDFIYLSDGGHFENLGLYELVRRRCKVIIVGDGECDPGFTFQGLGMAIRRCRVDFGVDIKIDPSLIRPDPQTGLSRAHVAIGKIKYLETSKGRGDVFDGTLIYIKSSMTGDEPRDVQQYRSENALFPHEPTGDQFYSEAQFESYRRLGRHAARRILSPSPKVCLDPSIAQHDWSEWQKKKVKEARGEKYTPQPADPERGQLPAPDQTAFHKFIEKLEKYWLPPPQVPVARFVHHAEALMDIWREAASDPELRELDELLIAGAKLVEKTEENVLLESPTPEPPSSSQTVSMPHTTTRKIAYLSQRIVQLMENVFLDLDLAYHAEHEDHQGWMAAFRFWAQNRHIQAAWEASKSTFGDRFQTFWNQQIKP